MLAEEVLQQLVALFHLRSVAYAQSRPILESFVAITLLAGGLGGQWAV